MSTDSTDSDGMILDVRGLSVGYGDTLVLEDVSFSVGRGEVLTVLGHSGCGKTTLLRAMVGLLSPARGSIRVAGVDVASDRADRVRDRLRGVAGVLFQSGALLGSFSVGENIALPLRTFTALSDELIRRTVQIKLGLVGLEGNELAMPSSLSGGMRKRAGLARALALSPKILFCDEPASGLDPETARGIDELLLELNRVLGVTLFVVSHEVGTIRNLSSRCIMLDGEARGIIASGSLGELEHESGDERVRAFFQRSVAKSAQKGETP